MTRRRRRSGKFIARRELPAVVLEKREHNNESLYGRKPHFVCCAPLGCQSGEPIAMNDETSFIHVKCSNPNCTVAKAMHKGCFHSWEEKVLAYLSLCGQDQTWNRNGMFQNIWSISAPINPCECLCGQGFLRRENPQPSQRKLQLSQSSEQATSKALVEVPTAEDGKTQSGLGIPAPNQKQGAVQAHRSRAFSLDSQGSSGSGSSSLNSTCGSPVFAGVLTKCANENSLTKLVSSGNMFKRREDYSNLDALPLKWRNPVHIKMADEGPYGNDEIRTFLLTSLSKALTSCVNCVTCHQALTVYDRYPVIDGTFFLSPLRYRHGIEVTYESRTCYLTAMCMQCLFAKALQCRCGRAWNPDNIFIIGTMYSYDIIAALPCCQWRMSCNRCGHPVIPWEKRPTFYSAFSQKYRCPNCRLDAYHFVKPLELFKCDEYRFDFNWDMAC